MMILGQLSVFARCMVGAWRRREELLTMTWNSGVRDLIKESEKFASFICRAAFARARLKPRLRTSLGLLFMLGYLLIFDGIENKELQKGLLLREDHIEIANLRRSLPWLLILVDF